MRLTLWLWTLLTGSRFKAMRHEGYRYMRNEMPNEALDAFRALVKGWPDQPDGYMGMSEVYVKMGLRLEAVREKTIGQGLAKLAGQPDDVTTRMEVAEALLEKDMPDWAASHIEIARKKRPEDPYILRLAARAHRRNNNHRKAVGALREALRLNPLDAELYDNLTASLRAVGQHTEAARIGSLGEALTNLNGDPTNSLNITAAVRQFMTAGYLRLALEIVDRCIVQGADDAKVHLLRASLMLEDRDPKEALASLAKAVERDPLNIEVHRLLAEVNQITGNTKRADYHREVVKTLVQANLAKEPAAAAILHIEVLLGLEQIDRAEAIAQRMAKTQPDNWRTFLAGGMVARHKGDLKQALTLVKKALERNSTNPAAHLEMAYIHSAAGAKLEAVGKARDAVKMAPRDADIRRKVAAVMRKHGFMDMAIEEEELADSLEKGKSKEDKD